MFNAEMIAFYSNGDQSASTQFWSTKEGYPNTLGVYSITFEVLNVNPGVNSTIKVIRKLDTQKANNNAIVIDKNTSMISSIALGVTGLHKHATPSDHAFWSLQVNSENLTVSVWGGDYSPGGGGWGSWSNFFKIHGWLMWATWGLLGLL